MIDGCIKPGAIQEGDLEASLEGMATPAVSRHLAACPACRAELEALRQTDLQLSAALFRRACPDPDTLLAWQSGEIDAAAVRKLEAHVQGCPHCRLELNAFEAAGLSPAPSAWERVKAEGRALLRAMLDPISHAAPALRGGGKRRLSYQAGDFQIQLEIQEPLAEENLWGIDGQIVAPGELPLPIQEPIMLLGEEGIPVASDRIDDLGFFTFGQVGPGRYTLQLDLPDVRLQIEDLHLPLREDRPLP